jgi:phosphatidylserine/phosphatidylglycerophosphate/cardiolipin synthase-like enzyme
MTRTSIGRALGALLFALPVAACDPLPPPARPLPAPVASATPRQEPGTALLVESAPIETTLDHPDIPNADEVWVDMIRGAAERIDVAQFYVSNAPGSRLEPVLQSLEQAASRGVVVRILADASFYKKYPESLDRLGSQRRITVRLVDMSATMGGILHAKYFVIDGREAYVGSQNFDHRSLEHIQEIGVRIRDQGAAAEIDRVFAMDWALAAGEASKPEEAQPELTFPVVAAGAPAALTPVFSPKGYLPDPRTWELPRIIALIDGASRSVHVQVLMYKLVSRDGSAFPDLDDALRRAAARGVEVRLLVSDWATHNGTVEALRALARVPGVKVEVLTIPAWSGGPVPFARVAHAKYLVVDGARAWIGSSNWEGDYFTRSRNVGVIIEGPAFAARLDRVFEDGWRSRYASAIGP